MAETKINQNQIADNGSGNVRPYLIANNTGLLTKLINVDGYMGGKNKYLRLSNKILTQNYTTWEIEIVYTHCYAPNTFSAIIGQDLIDYSGLSMNIYNGFFCFNTVDQNGNWGLVDTSVGLAPSKGQKYYIKFGYDGNKYYFKYKLNDYDAYIDQWESIAMSNNYQVDKFCLIGSNKFGAVRYSPSIISDFKFVGDSDIIFDLATAQEGTDFTNVMCDIISSNYDIILE